MRRPGSADTPPVGRAELILNGSGEQGVERTINLTELIINGKIMLDVGK